jgi:hypothetical protein
MIGYTIRGSIRRVRRIHVKKVSYDPELFKYLFTNPHVIEWYESDDTECQKDVKSFLPETVDSSPKIVVNRCD